MDRWKKIRLELARTTGFPSGSVSRGYLMQLPLDPQGRVDGAALAVRPHWATIRRYWSTEPDEMGILVPSGEGYAMRGYGAPERTILLDGQSLEVGEQLLVLEPDGAILPFKIASIR